MEKLLELLEQRGLETDEEIALKCGISVDELQETIAEWKKEGVIVGQPFLLNHEKLKRASVKALIEVKIKPEAGGGYDRLANRIARFDQVISCSLFSGEYDLLIEVEVQDNLQVAQFVFDTLSKIDGVISTRTHFPLKVYKANGISMADHGDEERLPVTP